WLIQSHSKAGRPVVVRATERLRYAVVSGSSFNSAAQPCPLRHTCPRESQSRSSASAPLSSQVCSTCPWQTTGGPSGLHVVSSTKPPKSMRLTHAEGSNLSVNPDSAPVMSCENSSPLP